MRKYLILILVLISIAGNAAKIPCYIIKHDGDTLRLTLKISIYSFFKYDTDELAYRPNIIPLQKRIICYNSKKRKYVIYPSQIKEFGFTCDDIEYRFLSRTNNPKINRYYNEVTVRKGDDGLLTLRKDSCAFLLLEMDGYLKMFTAYISRITRLDPKMPAYIYYVERYYFQKGDEQLIMVDPVFFKGNMQKYFSDCPQLADRIANRELRKDDLYEIVNFYNSWIRNKKLN